MFIDDVTKKNKSFKRCVIKCLEKNNEKLATNSMENLTLYILDIRISVLGLTAILTCATTQSLLAAF